MYQRIFFLTLLELGLLILGFSGSMAMNGCGIFVLSLISVQILYTLISILTMHTLLLRGLEKTKLKRIPEKSFENTARG